MSFKKACGNFEIECSDPWPVWVKLRWGSRKIDLVPSDMSGASIQREDLLDLKYLIDRALAETEPKQNQIVDRA